MERNAKLYILAACAGAMIGFIQVLHYWESDVIMSVIYLLLGSACAFIGLDKLKVIKKQKEHQKIE